MPLYPHTTFPTIITNPDGSTSGVPIPDPQYTDAEKAVIQLALDGESLFENPVEGAQIASAVYLGNIIDRITYLAFTGDRPLYGANTGGLTADLITLRNKFIGGGEFRDHTARISGASGGKYYESPDNDFFAFNALQGIASAYNSAVDAMRDDEDPVVDNYSTHFTSILDSGQNMMSDILDYVGNDGLSLKGRYLGFNLEGVYDQDSVEITEEDLPGMEADIESFISAVSDLRQRDDKTFEESIAYLEKYARGNIVLSMNSDQYFGGRLLDSVASEELTNKLNDVEIL
jgi:hypothetical protein